MKIAIAGCTGRMGVTLLRVAAIAPDCTLVMGGVRAGMRAQAQETLNALGLNVPLADDISQLVASADAVIDFTSAPLTCELAKTIAAAGKIHIIGTTGFTHTEQQLITQAAQHARIVQSANFSLGVNVLSAVVEQAARLLEDNYDIEIDEMHHRMKKDAPSGTALLLATAAAQGRGVKLEDARRHYGEGMIGAREHGTIGLSSRRGGEVVGVHTVTLAGPGETLELTHRAQSRDIYAHGALKAASWARDQEPGLYSMKDVLGL